MGEISIRFRMNAKTGKKDIVIDYRSDEDAMRHEHEKDHRRVVERLVGAGLLSAEEAGEVVVERAAPGLREASAREGRHPPEGEAHAQAGSG